MSRTSPHVALFPNAGMGHLMPYIRLASELLRRGCSITLITARPVVSAAEASHISSFLADHPRVNALDLQLICDPPSGPEDPFFLQFDRIGRSTHLLGPLLSSVSPPLSAIFADLVVAKEISPIAGDLSIALYFFCTTSISFFTVMAHLPKLIEEPSKFNPSCSQVTVPGIRQQVPVESIPPPFFNPHKHVFTTVILRGCQGMPQSRGILMNTFDWLEPSTLSALNHDRVLANLPQILPIGPLQPCDSNKVVMNVPNSELREWLQCQPTGSVLFVSFGSRTAMLADQIKELRDGLARSGCRFIWVVKTSKVDTDEAGKEGVDGLLGETFLEKTKGRGRVVNGWVVQEEILASPAIGGFMSHCGWNSVMEAAWTGVPLLGWPLHGDQRVNARVVEDSGLGIWMKNWGMGNEGIVKGKEIGEKIVEMMTDERLRETANKVKEEARKAVGVGGSSDKTLDAVLQSISVPARVRSA